MPISVAFHPPVPPRAFLGSPPLQPLCLPGCGPEGMRWVLPDSGIFLRACPGALWGEGQVFLPLWKMGMGSPAGLQREGIHLQALPGVGNQAQHCLPALSPACLPSLVLQNASLSRALTRGNGRREACIGSHCPPEPVLGRKGQRARSRAQHRVSWRARLYLQILE